MARMFLRFIGQYTNSHTSITLLNTRFDGREPTEVSGEVAERLARHPEFEVVEPVSAPIVEAPFMVEPIDIVVKRRGRPRKEG